ncbi:MAG: hypothetical protein GX567_05415 [Clostridia bacterium]|nr:hypothetical protein [Clostridia bacterium]
MGSKDRTTDQNVAISNRKKLINMIVFSVMFAGYTLTFLVPKFYGATDAYASVFIFVMCGILFLNNVDLLSLIRSKNKEFIILAVVIVIIGLNLIIIQSNKGAFFVAANFILIWYLSDKIILTQKQISIIGGCYLGLLLIWLVIAYPVFFGNYDQIAYNTNTAATFTVYTLLCAFIFLRKLSMKHEMFGLLTVILLVRTGHLVLWHRARGAFIMLILFLFLFYLMPRLYWKNRKLYTCLIMLATIGSLLFVSLYVLIGSTGVNFRLPFFYKNIFSGRQKIWLEIAKMFVKQPLTGIGSGYVLDSFFEYNLHNAMYDIIAVHGVIVFAGTLFFIIRRLKKFREHAFKSELAVCALCAVFAVFFESYFDIDLIWADYAPNLLFLLAVLNTMHTTSEQEEVTG